MSPRAILLTVVLGVSLFFGGLALGHATTASAHSIVPSCGEPPPATPTPIIPPPQ